MPDEGTPEAQEATTSTEVDAPQEGDKQFDADYVRNLRSEAARYRKEAQEAKARAQEFEDRDKSELEKAASKIAKAEQARAEAEARLLRYEVAAEKQVPAEALDLLTGSTREELEAKADKLLSLVKKPEQNPDFDGGTREPAPTPQKPEDEHNSFVSALLGGNPR